MKEGHQIARCNGRPRKTIRKDLQINELKKYMIFNRTLRHPLIHMVDHY